MSTHDGSSPVGSHSIDIEGEDAEATVRNLSVRIDKVAKDVEELSSKVDQIDERMMGFLEMLRGFLEGQGRGGSTAAGLGGSAPSDQRRRVVNADMRGEEVKEALSAPTPPRGSGEESAIRRKEQGALRAEYYKAGQHFAQCLFPLGAIIAGGFQVVDLNRMLTLWLSVLVALVVLLLGLSCLLKMWLLYYEDKYKHPFSRRMLVLPFYMDLVAAIGGALGLFVIFGMGAARPKH